MKIEKWKMEDAPGAMLVRDGEQYKRGRHGYTYRWSGTEWVRSSCKLEKLFGGGWVLRQPKPVPRVHSDFVLPPSSMRPRG